MPQAIKNYLEKLSPRDRIAVILLAIFVLVSLGGLGALKLHRAADKAQQQAQQEQELLIWLQASAPLLNAGSSNNGMSVLDTVSSSAGGLGITMQRFEPDGDSVRVWLEGADFAKVATWLNNLTNQGVKAQEVHFEQNSKGLTVRLVFGR